MKHTLIPLLATLLLLSACHNGTETPSREALIASVDSIEQPLMQAANLAAVDTLKGRQLIDRYLRFANNYPDDSLAASYLQRAAQVANALDQIDEMVSYYDRVIDNYPQYNHLDECYYEKGIALDNAGRKEEAREAYKAFLEEYPNHFLTDDIRRALALLDMSDELLLEYLKQHEH